MQSAAKLESWAVDLMTIHGKPSAMHAVCPPCEWDAMELARPGYHVLVRGGIHNEAEAQKLARGTSGGRRLH
jgi:hypothetical protein